MERNSLYDCEFLGLVSIVIKAIFFGKREGLGFSIYIEVLSIGHLTLNPLSFFLVIKDLMQ
jgi:hypothetical protein